MPPAREKFATQVNSDILREVRKLAEKEGRELESLVEEALADVLDKHTNGKPRAHVMEAYFASHERFAPLYKKLGE
jgi:hypothetical protein